MKIVIADPLPESAITPLRDAGWTVDVLTNQPPEALAAALVDADALIVRSATSVDAALLEQAPHLRVVARAGTGVDNVDVEAANRRGIVVMNAPGANSVSVAEHTLALILALARHIPDANASLKRGEWDKSRFIGMELRGKTLGLAGLGRVGRGVAVRAHALGMEVIAYDTYIAKQVAADLDIELVSLGTLVQRADFVSLHLPSVPTTRHLVNARLLAQCKPGLRLINTARGDLIDEAALADAIESGRVAGAALDVFGAEPPVDNRLLARPEVIATPHIAGSTREAQELVGTETANAVRDFLRDGVIRNAVNLPSVSREEYTRLRPHLVLAERLGSLLGQLLVDAPESGRIQAVTVGYYGELATANHEMLGSAVLVGMFRPMLSASITAVNARAVAAERGIELVESRSTRPRRFTNLIAVRTRTEHGERQVEGSAFEDGSVRLVMLDGVDIEAPLDGTLLVISNRDQPGVIGDVGSIMGRHHVNIANFALGRGEGGAVGVVTLDEDRTRTDAADGTARALEDIRTLAAVRHACCVRF